MNTAGAIVLAIVLALLVAAAAWIIFTRVRASRLGLPPPSWKSYIPFFGSSSSYSGPRPAPGGLIGWFNDRIRSLRNRRTAAGAYEGTSYNAGYSSTRRGFEHLDDDPWDSRVGGYNPYEEERELGLAPPSGHGGPGAGGSPYVPQGDGYQMNEPEPAVENGLAGGAEPERGRPRSRSPGPAPPGARQGNPFDDAAEPSNIGLRGVSPRPITDQDKSFAARKARGEDDRRSIFREEM
ncbi:hypothetical protein VTJ04DRAFT_5546 [Mycothermus thermophilus]|uniref:uncharacterized protein n=1 Tax=Humicola insolens TaxID=85995 RepID=UPI003743C55D